MSGSKSFTTYFEDLDCFLRPSMEFLFCKTSSLWLSSRITFFFRVSVGLVLGANVLKILLNPSNNGRCQLAESTKLRILLPEESCISSTTLLLRLSYFQISCLNMLKSNTLRNLISRFKASASLYFVMSSTSNLIIWSTRRSLRSKRLEPIQLLHYGHFPLLMMHLEQNLCKQFFTVKGSYIRSQQIMHLRAFLNVLIVTISSPIESLSCIRGKLHI